MRRQPVAFVIAALGVLGSAAPAAAQKVTTVEEQTLKQALGLLANVGPRPSGEAIAFATALEVATTPLATSSGGFVFKLDPSTGLLQRTTRTFGPSFTERAITQGEGQVSAGVTFNSTSYDSLTDFSMAALPIGGVTSSNPTLARSGTANVGLTAKTVTMSTMIGVSENLDVGAVIPLVSIELDATSAFVSGTGVQARTAVGTGVFAGIGDVSALVKYRFLKFAGGDLADPGGVALLVNMRLPTGDKENLRGLGISRTLASVVVSGGRGRIHPHASGGFEFWNNSVSVPTSFTTNDSAVARHQVQYAGGIEIEATPKVTLIADYIGQHILGAGQVGTISDTVTNRPGVTSLQSLIALPNGITKGMVVPGVKVNVKGKLLLSLNALITVTNNGLRPNVTPVVGLNLTL